MPLTGLLVLVAIVVMGASRYGASHWQARTRQLHTRLESGRRPVRPAVFDARELACVPAPVARYFRTALEEGQPVIAAARIEHRGTFNMGEAKDQWKPFTSSQRVITQRPGFVWDARVAMIPGLAVRVHDAYVDGEGILHAALLGVVPVADMRGTAEVAQGELYRFLAEAAWYPTALLPSQGMRWEAVDDRSARATLTDSAYAVTMLFRFNDAGLIESVRAEARGRGVRNKVIPTPWEARYWSQDLRCGMQVPTDGEVAWLLPHGRTPYWRGHITRIEYEFAQ